MSEWGGVATEILCEAALLVMQEAEAHLAEARRCYAEALKREKGERSGSRPDLSTVLFLSVEDAAAVIGLGRTKMYELVRRGVIFSVKVGKRRLVSVHALERYRASMEEGECLDAATEKGPLPIVEMVAGRRA